MPSNNSSKLYNKNRPIEGLFQNSIARTIDFFVINPDFLYSINEISELTKISTNDLSKILITLLKKGIIIIVKTKNSSLYRLNRNSELAKLLSEYLKVSIKMEIDRVKKKSKKIEQISYIK